MEESSRPRLSELGRLLAAADGYAVFDASGRQVGRVDRVRYERHTDRPDEIVVRRGRLWKRELVVPLKAIEAVDRASSTIRLRCSAPSGSRARPRAAEWVPHPLRWLERGGSLRRVTSSYAKPLGLNALTATRNSFGIHPHAATAE